MCSYHSLPQSFQWSGYAWRQFILYSRSNELSKVQNLQAERFSRILPENQETSCLWSPALFTQQRSPKELPTLCSPNDINTLFILLPSQTHALMVSLVFPWLQTPNIWGVYTSFSHIIHRTLSTDLCTQNPYQARPPSTLDSGASYSPLCKFDLLKIIIIVYLNSDVFINLKSGLRADNMISCLVSTKPWI